VDTRDGGSLDGLAEDLVLLSVSPSGRLATAQRIDYGLMGSELVRLAAAGRITIAANRVVVGDLSPCGDPELDAALSSLAGARRAIRPRAWVSRPRRAISAAYLARLASAGAVRAERRGIFPVTRWRITDAARVADARARLDAIALSVGPVGTVQAAYAGLAHAVGLGGLLYRGREHRQARKRLEEIATSTWPASAASEAGAEPGAVDVTGTTTAAHHAAVHAAHDAVAAAVEAATAAAVHAAVDAAHHAGADSGSGGHGGHH